MRRLHGTEIKEAIASKTSGSAQLSPTDRLRCLDFNETVMITGLSPATLYRLGASGKGPPRIKLSERRWGYPLGALADWMAARTIGESAFSVDA